jgi:hypothetical protein
VSGIGGGGDWARRLDPNVGPSSRYVRDQKALLKWVEISFINRSSVWDVTTKCKVSCGLSRVNNISISNFFLAFSIYKYKFFDQVFYETILSKVGNE